MSCELWPSHALSALFELTAQVSYLTWTVYPAKARGGPATRAGGMPGLPKGFEGMQSRIKYIRIHMSENTLLYFLFGLVLAALPALGAAPEVPPVAVYTHFDHPPSQRV